MVVAAVAIALIASLTLITRWALAYAPSPSPSPSEEPGCPAASEPRNGHTHPECTRQDEPIPDGMRCVQCVGRSAADEVSPEAIAYADELELIANKLHRGGMDNLPEFPSLGRSELRRANQLRGVIKDLRSGKMSREEAIEKL